MGKRVFKIKRQVFKKLLANLFEFQEVWHKWKPELYSPIEIIADEITDNCLGNPEPAFLAFCKGLESLFSKINHIAGLNSYRSKKNKRAVLIQGFDIPLDLQWPFVVAQTEAASI